MAAPFSVPPPGLGQEVWIEAKAPDGKSYYYHSVTRETSWSIPTGVQVIKHAVPDAAATAGGAAVAAGGSSVGQAGSVAAQNAVAQAQAASQYQLGSAVNQAATIPLSVQQPAIVPGVTPINATSIPGAVLAPGMPNPMFGMGIPPGVGFMNPFAPMMMQTPGMVMPQIHRGDPADWVEYTAPDGRSYWFNSKLGQTSWEKPPEVAEFELKKKNEVANAAATKPAEVKVEVKKEVSTKPIATKQIPGTPWCVVWTSDKKSFFHNPSTKASVWKRPPELLGMKEVDDLLAQVPEDPPAEVKPTVTNGEANGGAKRDANSVGDDQPAKRLRAGSVEEGSISDTSSTECGPTGNSGLKPGARVNVAARPKEKAKDPAYEAEQKAAKDRETIPLEERIVKFKELLSEKDVSAYSTWEKELHKIVFDPRYLLLTSKDRRDVFDDFTKGKAEKEREEKKRKLNEARDNFKALLREAGITSKITYTEFAAKWIKDERFQVIERMKEREQLFEDYMYEVKKKEKDQRRAETDKIRANFVEMLNEVPGINRKSHWSDVKKKVRGDPRYERIDSSNQREEWFREHVKTLAKKKEKETDETEEKVVEEEDEKVKQDRDKQERIDASLRERERQVQEEMSTITKDREKEREHHRFDEAVQHYKALLTDLIRQTDLTYKEARKLLKKDSRYELADPLSKHDKEEIYDEHLDALSAKKKQLYRELLDESSIALDATWKDVRRKIKEDPRYTKFSSSDSKCEKEFHKYLKDKTGKAVMEFKDLLKETKLLDFKSKSRIEESEQHMKDLVEILKNDRRYLILEPLAKERSGVLMDYMEEMAKRGMPPPPTASEPSRRAGK